jgi:hypothetical protein
VGLRLKVGQRVLDGTSAGEFIVVRAPDADVDLTIGEEAPLLDGRPDSSSGSISGAAVAMGKRYASDDGRLELLCVKPGANLPVVSGCPLEMVEPKPLPSSD